MQPSTPVPIFVMYNGHTESSGNPPAISNAEALKGGHYYGYFENVYGEQSIFVYDRSSGVAMLYCSDARWEHPYPVQTWRRAWPDHDSR